MNKDQLERRIEIRMENCEDALTHHPDSVAWLGRYHELCEIAHLVGQLDQGREPESPYVLEESVQNLLADMGQDGLTLDDGGTMRLLSERYGTGATPSQLQWIFQHLEAVKVAFPVDEDYRRVVYGPAVRFVLAKYAKPQEAPQAPEGPDPAQDKGDQANVQPASEQLEQMPEMGRLPLRRKVLELVQEGEKTYGDIERATGQGSDVLLPVVKWLLNHRKIEEYEPFHLRIPDMRPVVRARKQAEKLRGQAGKTRPEYKGTPDGSRSWAIALRKAILGYLKGSVPGMTVKDLQEAVSHEPGFSGKILTQENVQAQLKNLKQRSVVAEAAYEDGQESLWKAARE